jgi:hypothetical protein
MLQASADHRLSPKKVALLHVARKQLALSEENYRAILFGHGNCESSADLDELGFELVMAHMNALGFRSTWTKRSFGNRAGMASPSQIGLMRKYWSAYRGPGDPDENETGLNAWLTKYHKVSALRFVTAAKANAVMRALREMAERKQA